MFFTWQLENIGMEQLDTNCNNHVNLPSFYLVQEKQKFSSMKGMLNLEIFSKKGSWLEEYTWNSPYLNRIINHN